MEKNSCLRVCVMRLQIDALPAPASPASSRPDFTEPALGPIGESRELWLAIHLPQLTPLPQAEPRDERRRRQALEHLAMKGLRFTPRVSLAPPDGLLLEVKGSLHLVGGTDGLCAAIKTLHQSLGFQPLLALAPTPLAALVCARAHTAVAVLDHAHLVGQVASLPLATLRWPAKIIERLAKIGVYTIGQALRLPRAGFARRFGIARLASLDRLTGRCGDPQAPFRPRERFRRRREFNFEIEDQALILKMLQPLLQQLEKFLQARDCGVAWLECLLRHRHAPPTSCLLKLAAPAADARRLSMLLGEKLLSLALPEPVRSCELRTGAIVPCAPASRSLWQAGERGGEAGAESPQLVEYLRARLGDEAVYGLQQVSGHRPEKLWRSADPGSPCSLPRSTGEGRGGGMSSRPLWLLPAPKLLDACTGGLPRYRGPLQVSDQTERLETGWWDGADIARDYYTAFDLHGVKLWIFRECEKPHRWFLHGLFG
jgi:protein ImuB